jgi:hypothetical protein
MHLQKFGSMWIKMQLNSLQICISGKPWYTTKKRFLKVNEHRESNNDYPNLARHYSLTFWESCIRP